MKKVKLDDYENADQTIQIIIAIIVLIIALIVLGIMITISFNTAVNYEIIT
jgi:hypothetical protein